jgi:type II secretory pathway component PulM
VINRHQDPASKREEEFQFQVQQARQTPGGMEKATPEVREAATRQANFSEQRKKYLGGM